MPVTAIEQLCASHDGSEDFFFRFRDLACRMEGVLDVSVIAAREESGDYRPRNVFASAPIRFLDEAVGEVRVFLRMDAFRESSPLPVARFLARQLGIAIQASAVYAANRELRERRAETEAELHEHKLMERARGVIETRRLIPAGEGERLLKKASEQAGKNPRDVARGIVEAANKNPWRFRREFWA